MNTYTVMHTTPVDYEALAKFSKAIKPVLGEFVDHVGEEGLWARIEECDKVGMSGRFGATELRTMNALGRIMLTFEDDKNEVTFVTDEDHPSYRIGLQSANAEVSDVERLLGDVIGHWSYEIEEQRRLFKADGRIKMI